MSTLSKALRRRLLPVALAAVPGALAAQSPADAAPSAASSLVDPLPPTIEACYVPASGTIYRINTAASPAPGAPAACLSAAHVKFLWNQQGPAGPPGPPGASTPATIGPDLTLDGKLRAGLSGWFDGGLVATATTPVTLPAGTAGRMLWVPQRSAFRAGAPGSGNAQWSEANIGTHSAAFGLRVNASGASAFAVGEGSIAGAARSIALGSGLLADAEGSVLIGHRAWSNGKTGAIVLADLTGTVVGPEVNNEFVVRAGGGVRMRTSSDLAKGCNIDTLGNLTCTGGMSMSGTITRLTFEWVRVNGVSSRTLTLVCPLGTVIVGGGAETEGGVGTGDFKVRESFPSASQNAWVAQVRNDALDPGNFRVHAICMRQ